MATITKRTNKRGEVSYRALIRVKGYPPQSKTFIQRTNAQEWAMRTELQMKDGKFVMTSEAQHRTVAELIDKFIAETLPEHKQKAQANYLNTWKDLIGQYALIAVKRDLINDALNKIRKMPTPHGGEKTPATLNRYISAISVVFTYAYKQLDWIERNPFDKVQKYKEPRGRVRFLTDDEREKLLRECMLSQNSLLYPAVLLAITTGARKEEIMSLRWEDIDLHGETKRAILQKTKNGERRSISIVEPALTEMLKLEQKRGTNEYVFAPQRESKIKHHANITHAWYNALRRAGITNFRFHDLRHTAASYLAMHGATNREMAEFLGHKTPQMTMRYAHLSDRHQFSLAESIMSHKVFAQTPNQGGETITI